MSVSVLQEHRSNPPIGKNLEIKSTSDTQSSILASLIPFPLTHSLWPACHQISFQRQKNDFSKVDREWTIKIAAGQVGSKCSRHLWNSLATHRAQTVIRGNAAIFNSAASNNCSVTLSILKLQKLKPRFEDILTLRNSTWLQLKHVAYIFADPNHHKLSHSKNRLLMVLRFKQVLEFSPPYEATKGSKEGKTVHPQISRL